MTTARLSLYEPATWFKAALSTALLVPLLGLLALTIDVARDQYFEYDHWFKYYSVSPVDPPFVDDESLLFESDFEIKRPIEMEWNDILFCDFQDGLGYRYFSNYQSKRHQVEPRSRVKALWVYGGRTPVMAATCFLHSTISGRLEFSGDKVQAIIGPEFSIKLAN